MFKKPQVKLKEQKEQVTLRQAASDAPVPPEDAAQVEGAAHYTEKAVETRPTDQNVAQSPETPIKGKRASQLSTEDLTTLATHPDSIEADWLPAFTELEKRPDQQSLQPARSPRRRYGLWVVTAIALSIGSLAVFQFSQPAKAPVSASAYNPNAPYLEQSSQIQASQLRERAIVRLAQTIDARGWTTAKAAQYFKVSEQEINNLMIGELSTLNTDDLNKMLFQVGASTVFPTAATSEELHQAVAYYTRMIAVNPKRTRALYERAAAYKELGQTDLAIADLKRCAVLNPTKSGPLMNITNAYQDAGRNKEALQTLEEWHRLFPDDDIYQQRALIYSSLGQYDRAIADSTKSIQLMKSERPGPYLNRALDYEKLGKYKEAITDCQKVLEIDPTYDSAAKMITEMKSKLDHVNNP